MPIATALSPAFSVGIGVRKRPIGRPMKIVNPAKAPSRAIWLADMLPASNDQLRLMNPPIMVSLT
ncbi:hypothetical protein GCM10010533_17420 [Mycolicibacterium pallens]